ncbi:MAG: methyltransferase domain-containing protein [Microcoleus sp. PH2017_25_DOB_D_A]|uniref:class I SAM-dependent methyltransferase n=1 Tax=unclassified Microcoleus TaxID=2642155 RepID=UPI001D556B52|nr:MULTISPECIES: methyltransferase domain-containing protein [unclassified Microcoleus]MCC3534168.1 methyltransferase domain-containing protein [Microcoleus sp. PH2017_25_DOB_D_A]MCC3546499.1 methyltransferase domain-containing protein [Microcoleus sp. PH2017_24_DOB_U_A]TAE41816.1 MAG: methyltransferase domain-containing protein [Oscillatoriales cyanobacterium]
MDNQELELIEKIRQQFDNAPYPKVPLDQSPKTDYQSLYIHNLVTAYYLRNQKVIDTEGKVILDAGCGTGYKSLILAEANPGAKIVGIDISEESVELAQKRLQYHGFNSAEFHVLSIEKIPSLNLKFDYINNDEVLYILPDIAVGLQAMKSVLKPEGIIRTNLHSSLQRTNYYRAQALFQIMGLMNENPREIEIQLTRDIMNSLKDDVNLKLTTWYANLAEEEESVLMNYLFQGDKGYTISELFEALRVSDLEFLSMVNWRHWELTDLFKDPSNLPAFLEMSLPEISIEERLHLFELLQPVHRLIDFWCAHPNQAQSFVPVSEWTLVDWQTARVYLHPQIRTAEVRENLINCITSYKPFEISRYVPLPTRVPILIESTMAACLLPLWERASSVADLAERWLKLKPLHPVTLEAASRETASEEVKKLLITLEAFMYVLLELSA